MARKGKELEETVSLLHKILTKDEYEITSPDFLIDKITGQQREVDISIKANIGSIPLTIIIECRDRNTKQDSMWIEQLATKCQNLNVQKVIAVSSNDFTEPAKTTAKHYGIETRVLSQIGKEDIHSWFLGDCLPVIHKQYEIIKILTFELVDYNGNNIKFESDEEKFMSNNEKLSLNELFYQEVIVKQSEIFKDIPEDGIRIQKKVAFADKDQIYKMEISETEMYQLKGFTAEVHLWKELKKLPISDIIRYEDSDMTFLEGVSFSELEFGEGGKIKMGLYKHI
ncbi:restriction endonuclease [Methanohalophilus halophilus]|uniref:Restriction endonuclease n=1 Tax=Methanohalophilus halophilus TaxID=2177 RepID=A0A1L3Q025_9EURY|nr:restriction endonuclease [Methanohalophilus halophilus]APH38226.1 hypothetical protein BHR79_01155 [Methanohalophilus halophilus]RNI10907.1 hypothetical protein EFE40_01635 [Methanohalophilus halophilus]SDV99807.1 Restriction endonuclease [Methanohalophilus halophilus]